MQSRVPNASLAVVERSKVVDYLLNSEHPDNGGKAKFFYELGFTRDSWEALAGALHSLALNFQPRQSVESGHGKKYIVDGKIETPSGKTRVVRSIWIVEHDKEFARLVTAYPYEETDDQRT